MHSYIINIKCQYRKSEQENYRLFDYYVEKLDFSTETKTTINYIKGCSRSELHLAYVFYSKNRVIDICKKLKVFLDHHKNFKNAEVLWEKRNLDIQIQGDINE